MTKYSAFVADPSHIQMHLERALTEATTGRPGPVWLDVPSDVQTASMPKQEYVGDRKPAIKQACPDLVRRALSVMTEAERPVVLAGQGIKQSRTTDAFVSLIERLGIPFVSSYGARDLVPYDHHLNIGAIGPRGSRAGNFAMQASDALLILGCSLNVTHIGYDAGSWAPFAQKIVVDVDSNELRKGRVEHHMAINADLRSFLPLALEIANG